VGPTAERDFLCSGDVSIAAAVLVGRLSQAALDDFLRLHEAVRCGCAIVNGEHSPRRMRPHRRTEQPSIGGDGDRICSGRVLTAEAIPRRRGRHPLQRLSRALIVWLRPHRRSHCCRSACVKRPRKIRQAFGTNGSIVFSRCLAVVGGTRRLLCETLRFGIAPLRGLSATENYSRSTLGCPVSPMTTMS
jgi:hypothetical protein